MPKESAVPDLRSAGDAYDKCLAPERLSFLGVKM